MSIGKQTDSVVYRSVQAPNKLATVCKGSLKSGESASRGPTSQRTGRDVLHCAPSPHRCRLIVSRYWSESYAKACCGDLSVACHPPLRRQLSTSQPLSWHEKPRPPDRPTPQGSSLGAGYRTPAAHRSHSALSVRAHHTCPPTRF